MAFVLGARSLKELEGVHSDLVKVVRRAIEITEQDFAVHDGIRTAEEQRALYLKGASKLDGFQKLSRHQTGHAVDLVPYVNGKLRWEWPLIFPIAEAMKAAADELLVPIRWGGTWQPLGGIHNRTLTVEEQFEAASVKFADGVHFELPSDLYPA